MDFYAIWLERCKEYDEKNEVAKSRSTTIKTLVLTGIMLLILIFALGIYAAALAAFMTGALLIGIIVFLLSAFLFGICIFLGYKIDSVNKNAYLQWNKEKYNDVFISMNSEYKLDSFKWYLIKQKYSDYIEDQSNQNNQYLQYIFSFLSSISIGVLGSYLFSKLGEGAIPESAYLGLIVMLVILTFAPSLFTFIVKKTWNEILKKRKKDAKGYKQFISFIEDSLLST